MPTPITAQPNTALPTEHAAYDTDISALPRIFEDAINIAVMQRSITAELAMSANAQCHIDRPWQYAWLGSPSSAFKNDLRNRLPEPHAGEALVEDIATVAEAIAYLFDTDTLGIRLRLLTTAMCPRFHCDNLSVRLVTTYAGPASEWLPEHAINRAGLGAPTPDRPEIFTDPTAIQRLTAGDIALLKGSSWEGSEERGLVHRSPSLTEGQKRLLLTIDPA